MTQVSDPPRESRPLAAAAGGALLWGAGSTFICDGIQFASMLVLVRLLSPADYGRMALAQSVLSLISVFSFKTLALHALQLRDPGDVDWQAHFAAGSVLNTIAFVVTLLVAGLFTLTTKYAGAALPLALLGTVLLIEVPATLRQTMVQVAHNWARMRGLTIAGAIFASIIAVGIALSGGGIWALVAGPLLTVVPAALDLFFVARWCPTWSWSWPRYRETVKFGLTRTGSSGVLGGRQAAEQAMLAGAYDFSTLGLFTRSVSLATLAAGRIGALASLSLYPVITRAESGSSRFRRLAGLVLCGVAWTTIPASVILALSATDVVSLLYGDRWTGVVPLLPFAAAQAALNGVCWTAYTLLLANNEIRSCLAVDIASAAVGVILVFWLVPYGPPTYLAGMAVMYFLIFLLITHFLYRSGGISLGSLGAAFAPPLVSCAVALAASLSTRPIVLKSSLVPVRLGLQILVFSVVFAMVMRMAFPRLLREFLEVIPGGRHAARALALC